MQFNGSVLLADMLITSPSDPLHKATAGSAIRNNSFIGTGNQHACNSVTQTINEAIIKSLKYEKM